MRTLTKGLIIAATTAALSTPALAQDYRYPDYAAPLAGAAVGTVVGVGLYEGWFGSAGTLGAFPATAAGAATVGGVAAVGTIAVIDMVSQPCAGLNAFFGLNKAHCVNGQYVAAVPQRRVIVR
jgi:hypothetical protein